MLLLWHHNAPRRIFTCLSKQLLVTKEQIGNTYFGNGGLQSGKRVDGLIINLQRDDRSTPVFVPSSQVAGQGNAIKLAAPGSHSVAYKNAPVSFNFSSCSQRCTKEHLALGKRKINTIFTWSLKQNHQRTFCLSFKERDDLCKEKNR